MLNRNKFVSLLHKNKMMAFIQKYWFPILVLVVLVFYLIRSQMQIAEYKAMVRDKEQKIDSLKVVIKQDMELIEKLQKRDTVFVDRIREIKVKADEKIKLVDTMSVSSMQSFFTERYPPKQ